MDKECKCLSCIHGHSYKVSSCLTPECARRRGEHHIARMCSASGLRSRQCDCMVCSRWRKKFNLKKMTARVLPNKDKYPWEHAVKDLIGYDQNRLPPWIYDWVDAEHLSYALRIKLTIFLYGNGVSPDLIMEFYLERQKRWDYLSTKGEKHLATVLRDISEGGLKGSYVDLASGKGGGCMKRWLQTPNKICRPQNETVEDKENLKAQLIEDNIWKTQVQPLIDGKKRSRRVAVPSYRQWVDPVTKRRRVVTRRQYDMGLLPPLTSSTSK